jgi:hypothetical protein
MKWTGWEGAMQRKYILNGFKTMVSQVVWIVWCQIIFGFALASLRRKEQRGGGSVIHEHLSYGLVWVWCDFWPIIRLTGGHKTQPSPKIPDN